MYHEAQLYAPPRKNSRNPRGQQPTQAATLQGEPAAGAGHFGPISEYLRILRYISEF